MRTVITASLRTHTRRYVSAALAVAVGVAFVVVTAALASSTRSGLVTGIDAPYRHADAVVPTPSPDTAEAVMADHDALPIGWAMLPVSDGGRVLWDRADVGVVATDPAWQWQQLTAGRFPTGPGEAVVDSNTAKSRQLAVGDRLRIGSGNDRLEATIVGLVDAPSRLARASVYLTWPELLTWRDDIYLTSLAIAGDANGIDEAQSVATYLDDVQTDLNRQVDIVAIMLLLFAAIALFVSVLVIANTFSILFAQRLRDFALLRCVGVTRRQLLRSVRLEALAIGTLAGAVGLLAGVGIGHGVVALVRRLADSAPLGPVDIGAGWLVGAFLVGLGVTLTASWLPTRRVLRVSPMAALRPQEDLDLRAGAGRIRLGLGGLLVTVGPALLALAIATQSTVPMLAGGAASFTGVLLLGPVLVPALLRLAGGILPGTAARLASANAVRNPRRTAATAASLLVGVTLTTAVLTGMASARDAVSGELDKDYPIDLTITSTTPLGDVVRRVAAVPGVAEAVAVPGTAATVSGYDGPLTLLASPPGAASVTHSAVEAQAGEIRLPTRIATDLPSHVTITVGERSVPLAVVVGGRGWGDAGLVAPQVLAELTTDQAPYAVWIRAADDADPEDLAGDLGALDPDAEVTGGLSDRRYVDFQLDVFTGAVVGLLGISVLIALVGIANTLGLSVLERSREHALLRALGMTRRQLRRMLAAEAVLLSVVATVLGTMIGVTFAWVAVRTVVAQAVAGTPLVLPWGQLLIVVLVAGAAGLLACLLPARRAARVAPAAGLALD